MFIYVLSICWLKITHISGEREWQLVILELGSLLWSATSLRLLMSVFLSLSSLLFSLSVTIRA